MARDFAIQNPDQLLENMVLMRDLLATKNVRCFLHFGTLLGAIREKGFIPHDDDADIGVFGSDFDKVIGMLPLFIEKEYEFNSQRNGRLLQFVRKGEQVDIFFVYKKIGISGRKWAVDERATISAHFLDSLDTIQFLGYDFLIPTRPEDLMKNLYGKTWMIPMKDIPSRTNWTWKFLTLIGNPLKLFFYMKRFIRTQKRKSRNLDN